MYVIKGGSLFNVSGGAEDEFLSPFAEEFFEEESTSWGHEAWKYKQDDGASERGIVPHSMMWGGRGKGQAPTRVKFHSVFETPGRLYYVLQMKTSCGLFYFDYEQKQETRLFHRTDFQPCGLFINDDYSILTTMTGGDGATHLVRYDGNGKREQVLTTGDCRDENPYAHATYIYYQSSGLARNEQGQIMAAGACAICRYDPKTGDIEPVLESQKFDYLLPRVADDGALFCIRTPYKVAPGYPIRNRLLDIVLFPWRICVAIFAFLNVFSMFFAKKPLTTAGGPSPKQLDISRRIMHNRLVNLQETWKQEGKKVAVNKDWKLIRFSGGQTTEIASNVLWFDLDEQGKPVYTDGYSLYDSSGKSKFAADDLLSCVTLCRERTEAASS